MRELQVDGVRVFHVDGPATTTAVLLFDVGLRDEPPEATGVTHLIERLVRSTLPDSAVAVSCGVDVDHAAFETSGRPEQVGDVLARVCAAIRDLPLEHLAEVADDVPARGGRHCAPTAAAAWAARLGMPSPDLVVGRAAGSSLRAITGDQVSRHAARWFTTATAALAVVGPLPPDLRLPLPAGLRPDRPAPAVSRPVSDCPARVVGRGPGVGLLLDLPGPSDPAALVARAVLSARLGDATRDRLDPSGSIEVDVVSAGTGDVVTFAIDPREGLAADAAAVVWGEFTDLASAGPRPDELTRAVEGLLQALDPTDSGAAGSEALRAAFHAVRQQRFRTVDVIAAGCAATTSDDVARLLAAARGTSLLVVPEGDRVPASAVVSPPTAGRRPR